MSLKVPLPEVDQVAEVAPPPNEPDKICVDPEQMAMSLPAFTTGTAFMVSVRVSIVAVQNPGGSLVVNVNNTEPAVISADDGV